MWNKNIEKSIKKGRLKNKYGFCRKKPNIYIRLFWIVETPIPDCLRNSKADSTVISGCCFGFVVGFLKDS